MLIKCGNGEGEAGKKTKTTPDTGGKPDHSRVDDIQEEPDDNGGDDDEEDEDNEDDEEYGEGRVRRVVKTETGTQIYRSTDLQEHNFYFTT